MFEFLHFADGEARILKKLKNENHLPRSPFNLWNQTPGTLNGNRRLETFLQRLCLQSSDERRQNHLRGRYFHVFAKVSSKKANSTEIDSAEVGFYLQLLFL
ncbi:hypothetical protein M514_27911 [Trichuris suis]|uniref:Uncharacterized protein n=1 Tax=Trichuris suis TaxID=68888 RepID=A0A085MRS3_9BILA|nr:hypothetical protein M514_27911 [Trichuris suis]KHJ40012.1 hypothetical protein D918_09939 [Trichuris suis]